MVKVRSCSEDFALWRESEMCVGKRVRKVSNYVKKSEVGPNSKPTKKRRMAFCTVMDFSNVFSKHVISSRIGATFSNEIIVSCPNSDGRIQWRMKNPRRQQAQNHIAPIRCILISSHLNSVGCITSVCVGIYMPCTGKSSLCCISVAGCALILPKVMSHSACHFKSMSSSHDSHYTAECHVLQCMPLHIPLALVLP